MQCGPRNAAEAVATLRSLSGLTALGLAVHACQGTDQDELEERIASWRNWAPLPAFGPLGASLTRLRLVGAVSLPPDWRQLTRLQRLRVQNEEDWAAGELSVQLGWGPFEWGAGSLSGLTALTQLRVSGRGVLPGEPLGALWSTGRHASSKLPTLVCLPPTKPASLPSCRCPAVPACYRQHCS